MKILVFDFYLMDEKVKFLSIMKVIVDEIV